MTTTGEHKDTFEDTYPKYPFSELVRLSLVATKWVCRQLEAIDEYYAAKRLRKRRNQVHTGSRLG